MSATLALDTLVTRALTPLDFLRARALRLFGRRLAPLFRDRAQRTTFVTTTALLFAFVLSTTMPFVVLALGPLVLGVPHLVADVRYLVVRRGLHRRVEIVLVALACVGLAASLPALELAGLATIAAGIFARRTSSTMRRGAVVAVGTAIFLLGLDTGRAADVLFAHAHNLVAVVAWWQLRRRRVGVEGVVPLVIVLGAVAIATGHTLATERAWLEAGTPLPVGSLVTTLAPWDDHDALSWLALFAFLQSAHYVLWLRAIPEDARERRAPRAFVASYVALRRELGVLALATAALVGAGLLLWATVSLVAARDAYLRLALFHGPLELALLALAYAEGRRA